MNAERAQLELTMATFSLKLVDQMIELMAALAVDMGTPPEEAMRQSRTQYRRIRDMAVDQVLIARGRVEPPSVVIPLDELDRELRARL